MSKSIILYTKNHCPYCKRAKALLRAKGAVFKDIEITGKDDLAIEMIEKSGRRTVPQIFIDDLHVGGASDLFTLEEAGTLDALLGLAPAQV